MGAAVGFVDDDILGNVHQAARQITGVSSAQGGIGQALACAVRRDEVFLSGQTLAKVRADRHRDDASRRIRHQTAHTGQLRNGAEAAFGRAGTGHGGQVTVRVQGRADSFGDIVGGLLPDLDDALVLFLLGQQTAPEVTLHQFHILERPFDNLLFLRRDGNIGYRDGSAGTHGIFEANAFDPVGGFSRHILAINFVHFGNQVFHAAFFQLPVDELDFFRQDAVKDNAPNSGVQQADLRLGKAIVLLIVPGVQAHLDLAVHIHLTQLVG